MGTSRVVAALVLSLSCGVGAAACTQSVETSPETPQSIAVEDTEAEAIDDGDIAKAESALGELAHRSEDEGTQEDQQCLGYESPWPGPGTILPGGHDPGGPGYGWGHGWADDPQYAPYCKPRASNPYKEHRQANPPEYHRIGAENQRHGRARERNGVVQRRYPGGVIKAPDTPQAPQHGAGPLNDKARCEDKCWDAYLVDTGRCRKMRDKEKRHACWEKASDDLALCNRECSRKYPDPRL